MCLQMKSRNINIIQVIRIKMKIKNKYLKKYVHKMSSKKKKTKN